MRVRRIPLVLVLVAMLIAVLVAACSDPKPRAAPVTTAVPGPSTLPPTTSTTVRPTTTSSTVKPTTTVTTLLQLGPGSASIGGTVSGPAGPVEGATVHVERVVGKLIAPTDVTTTSGGSWQLPSILGGSYRVRAFKAPEFGQSPIEAFFLAATDRKTLDLKLPAAGGDRITAAVNPNPPRVDQPAVVTIQVGTGRVDDQGRPAITPRPGLVLTLAPGAGIQLESASQALTDANGSAQWRIRCLAEGARAVTLTIGTGVTAVNLPACTAAAPAPATTTTKAR